MKPKVYLETTIPSYLGARFSRDLLVAAHQQLTWDWWESRRDAFDLYISQAVLEEISAGDLVLAGKRAYLLADIPVLPMTSGIIEIAEILMKERAIPRKASVDALHIAIATAIYEDLKVKERMTDHPAASLQPLEVHLHGVRAGAGEE